MASEISDSHKNEWAGFFMSNERDQALIHAEEYLAYCRQCQSKETRSNAEFMLLRSKALPARMSEDARISLLETIRRELDEKIQTDKSNGWHYAQIEKQLLLVEVLDELGRLQEEEADEIIAAAAAVMEDAEATCAYVDWTSDNAYLRYEVAYLKGAASLALGDSGEAEVTHAEEVFLNFNQAEHIHTDNRSSYNKSHYFQQLTFAIQHQSLPVFERLYNQVSKDLLDSSETPEKLAELSIVKGMICHLLLEFDGPKIKEFWKVVGIKSMIMGAELTLDCFEVAFDINEKLKTEASTLSIGKTYFAQALDILVFDIALELCFGLKDKNRTWQWIQKRKARGISELLRKSFNVADANISNVPNYLSLLQKIAFEDLQWVQTASNAKLIFVDWVTFGTSPSKLLFFSFNMDRDLKTPIAVREMVEIESSLEELSAAARRINEARMNDSNADRYLQPFIPVISPLKDICEPGDSLLLSLTAPLHNVPLHAVKVDSVPLIERNPIVYVPSHAALVSCLQRRAAAAQGIAAPEVWPSAVFGAYDDAVHEARTTAERRQIYESLNAIASDLGSEAVLGQDLTKAAFKQHCSSAELVHFHGHGISSAHDPTQQALALEAAGEVIEMSEITDLHLNAAHVTLIACSGGVQNFSLSGDEPLGLLSSFLLGGASSVVGALWPIQSSTGRLFTRIFYNYFLNHLDRTERGPIVNLAKALQHSMLEVKRDPSTSTPYHWAAFLLYGTWFCRRKPGPLP